MKHIYIIFMTITLIEIHTKLTTSCFAIYRYRSFCVFAQQKIKRSFFRRRVRNTFSLTMHSLLPRRFSFRFRFFSFSLRELEMPRPTETWKDLKEGERCSRVCVAARARMGQRVIKSKRHLCRLHLPSRKKHLTVPL